jgi:hypothetical protein
MRHIYDRSEEFRAQIFFLLGSILATPFCLGVLEKLQDKKEIDTISWIFEIVMFVIGYLTVNESYSIMKKRDEENARKTYSNY